MSRLNLKVNNYKRVSILIWGLVILFISSVLIPFWFINYLSFSGVGYFFSNNIIFSTFGLVIVFYFVIVGEYYYSISVDPYSIQVRSYRVVLDFFRKKDFVDLSHDMLFDYAFFNRSFTLNKTLMLKIKNHKKKVIVKRFNLTWISKKEIKNISNIFDRIIQKNNTLDER